MLVFLFLNSALGKGKVQLTGRVFATFSQTKYKNRLLIEKLINSKYFLAIFKSLTNHFLLIYGRESANLRILYKAIEFVERISFNFNSVTLILILNINRKSRDARVERKKHQRKSLPNQIRAPQV